MRTTDLIPTSLIPASLFREMDRGLSWLGDVMGELAPTTSRGESVTPSVDLFETPEAYRIEMDLPGVRDEDVAVSLEAGLLDVLAERAHVERGEDEKARYVERRHERYERRLRLPGKVDEEKIEARLSGGVLTIVLPKAPETRARQIEVKRAD